MAVARRVEAAGGVVTRLGPSGVLEVLVVHRPRYDDWSLPKGKLEPGESHEDAARREVAEETGVVGELHRELMTCEYVDRRGRPKRVRWWHMTPLDTIAWSPNHEVDHAQWISVDEAATLLSYGADRELVVAVVGANGGAT